MTAVDWNRLEAARATAARATLWRHAAPLALAAGAAFLAWLPADPESTRPAWGLLTATLALAFAVVDAPAARRAFVARHQREVLPALFGHAGVELRAAPTADPPWVVCARTGLLPMSAEKAKPTPVFHGQVDGVPLEASAFVLTKTRVKRKVRKIDVPVFDGAVFVADLGAAREGAALWLGPRAGWAPRKAWATLWRKGGWLFGPRVYAARGASWSVDADAAIRAFLAMYPRAALSLADGRHLVAVVPGAGSIFRPSWPWVGVGHDRRGARAVEMARAVARVALALGLRPPMPGASDAGAAPAGDAPVNPFASAALPVPAADHPTAERPGHTLSKTAPAAPSAAESAPALAAPQDGAPQAVPGWGAALRASASALGSAVRGTAFAQRLEQAGWEGWDRLRGRMGMDVPEPTMTVRAVGPVSQGAPVPGLRKEPVLSASKAVELPPAVAKPVAAPVGAGGAPDAQELAQQMPAADTAPVLAPAVDASWSDADDTPTPPTPAADAGQKVPGPAPSPFGPGRPS